MTGNSGAPEVATDTSPIVVMGVSGSGKSTVGADVVHPPATIAEMTAGQPLNDDDRYPWLQAIGEWLAQRSAGGGVMSCSALKRRYRDQLREHCPTVRFLHLSGSPEVIAARQASRPGHFMPATLMASQFATLEPLEPDENGTVIDVAGDIDSIVAEYVARTTQQETR